MKQGAANKKTDTATVRQGGWGGAARIGAPAGEDAPGITVFRDGRKTSVPGPGGIARELAFLPSPDAFPGPGREEERLPVLIGSGSGAALEEIVARLEAAFGPYFTMAVADKEYDVMERSRVRERFARYTGIVWIGEADAAASINALTRLQTEKDGRAFYPLLNPLYLRLDRSYYARIHEACATGARVDFWRNARPTRFASPETRILLLTSKYFLMGEILSACERIGVPHRFLQVPEGEFGKNEFVEQFLAAVLEFRPDFVFTINHLGVDREGVLTDLLEKLRLPLASWFVDNPHLILYLFDRLANPWTTLFTWDEDNLPTLRELGFEHVYYMPLGTDLQRFHPPQAGRPRPIGDLSPAWDGKLSFVGNSMVHKVLRRNQRADFSGPLLDAFHEVAAGFARSDERSVRAFIERAHGALVPCFEALPDIARRLDYETSVTWEATRVYRLSCIRAILPFSPLIAGDNGWFAQIPEGQWHYHHELGYYADLPHFYPLAEINFNSTSKQMKGAVNQRVFDVPATGSFLLTDYREQVEKLFEPGREIICYRSPEEAGALAGEYLARPDARRKVAEAARRRILHEHSYDHRLRALMDTMRKLYG
ncbi:MAG: glycosyltransferase [Desulfovibrio sp.]|jgi:spore maturation protein CgeB|nr:glycosyltransferase [Desulfovibrio sp.]